MTREMPARGPADTEPPRPAHIVTGGGDRILASSAVTSGAAGLVEATIPPGHGPPLHVHPLEDEAFYVLHGILDIRCGDRDHRLRDGGFAYLPRGVPHTFRGSHEVATRVLILMVPGGLEDAFTDPHRFQDVFAARHVELVGPPIGPDEILGAADTGVAATSRGRLPHRHGG